MHWRIKRCSFFVCSSIIKFEIKLLGLGLCQKESLKFCEIQLRPRYVSTWKSSNNIRSFFVSFFKERNHEYIPSTSAISWNDSTIDFVNAGMNQFKSVFLDKETPPAKAVVNYQKCIRVGGKHNDLSDVGMDTYHHTFFEMLGNWSFKSYSKESACRMSWEFLTQVCKIHPSHLYVTFFSGDEGLNMQPDYEVQDIWRQIGIPQNKILPLGLKDNFWEMGTTGPCGPCTEIHFKYSPSLIDREMKNIGFEELIELWNLVFIQYQRKDSGKIEPLNGYHVDTGMGLERLVAVLNGQTSNYNTDLFLPIFDSIQKLSSAPKYEGKVNLKEDCLDKYYRILADHARMITVALSDGLLPHDSENLRKVIRRSLLIGSERFGLDQNNDNNSWLGALCESVVNTLEEPYPALHQNIDKIRNLVEYETQMFREIQAQTLKEWKEIIISYPELTAITNRSSKVVESLRQLLPVVSQLRSEGKTQLPLSEAQKMHRNYCLSPSLVEEIIQVLKFNFDSSEFRNHLSDDAITQNKPSYILQQPHITEDGYKYDYNVNEANEYQFLPLSSKISALFTPTGKQVDFIEQNDEAGIICYATNFYHEAGGQKSDVGTLYNGKNSFTVDKVISYHGNIIHFGRMSSGSFRKDDHITLSINGGLRFAASRHHTAHHLLVAAVQFVKGMAYQRGSDVSADKFLVDLFTHPPLQLQHIVDAEELVKVWISAGRSVYRETKSIYEAIREDHTALLSGVTYPERVHLITSTYEVPLNLRMKLGATLDHVRSCELCCGTHVLNTSHLGSFAIVEIEDKGNGITRIIGLCGDEAEKLNANVPSVKNELDRWDFKILEAVRTNGRLRNLRNDFKKWQKGITKASLPAPFFLQFSQRCNYLICLMDDILKQGSNWEQLLLEFREVAKSIPSEEPVIHQMKTDYRGSLTHLENIIKEIKDRPAAFVCGGWGRVRACVFLPRDTSELILMESFLSSLKKAVGGGSFRVTTCEGGHIATFILTGVKIDERGSIQSSLLRMCSDFICSIR